MLRTPEAAKYLALSVSTIEKLRLTGDGPKYIKLGRTVVYDEKDLDAWVDANRRRSTSGVASAPYNAVLQGLVADAKEARPMTAGGTGPALIKFRADAYDCALFQLYAKKRGVPLEEVINDAMIHMILTEEEPKFRVTSEEIEAIREKYPRAKS